MYKNKFSAKLKYTQPVNNQLHNFYKNMKITHYSFIHKLNVGLRTADLLHVSTNI